MAIWLMFCKFTVCVGDEISNFKYVTMKKAIYYGVCFLALVGCTRSVRDEVEIQEIRFKSNVRELEAIVRSSFSENDKVRLYIVEREDDVTKAALPKAGDINQMTSDGEGELHFDDQGKHYYPEKPIDIYGYCWKEEHDDTGDPINMSVKVCEDQSTEMGRMKSDFLYVKADNGYLASDEPIELEFDHVFAQIQINITTKVPETVDLKKISGVKLLNVVIDGIFNVGTGELVNGNTINSITMAAGEKAIVYILPQSVEAKRRLFSFTYAGEEYYGIVRAGGDCFEKGKIYQYFYDLDKVLGIGDKELVVKPSIKEWDDSEEPRTGEIEKEKYITATLTEISAGVVINKADLYLSSGESKKEIKDIEVTENKMRFVFPSTTSGGTMQLDKAHFYTEGGEEFDYYFEGKILAGNNADKIALPAPGVGDAWAGGTIFVVGEVIGYDDASASFKTNTDGVNVYRGRVVSNSSLGKLMWCSDKAKGYNSIVGAMDYNNGVSNMNAVKTFITEKGENIRLYPIFEACVSKGEEWYCPALNEITFIIANKDLVNNNIQKQGGDLFDDSVVYASSTERGGTGREVKDYYMNGKVDIKDFPSEVRAVRAY